MSDEYRGAVPCRILFAVALSASVLTAQTCSQTVTADVVALDQPFMLNRLGSAMPQGMIFALKQDVVDLTTNVSCATTNCTAGHVTLRHDKRARPLTLRMNQGQCMRVNFTNLLYPAAPSNDPLEPATRAAGIHLTGLELRNTIASDATWTGANANSLVAPGAPPIAYTYYAREEGTFLLYSAAGDWGGQLQSGLFGAVNVEPANAEWYRSQVTHEDLRLAAMQPAVGVEGRAETALLHYPNATIRRQLDANKRPVLTQVDHAPHEVWNMTTVEPGRQTVHTTPVVVIDNHIFTTDGRPLVDYNAVYPPDYPKALMRGQPILNMLQKQTDGTLKLIYSDLTAVITGPDAGRFDYNQVGPEFVNNPALPDRRQPFREITVIYHEAFAAVQPFSQFYDPAYNGVLGVAGSGAGADQFAINYGAAGITAEVLANRLGIGPAGNPDSVDLKFEEFFLSSWANGDPAMVVDVPANANNQTIGSPAAGSQIDGTIPLPPPPTPAFTPLTKAVATKAFYPDDPSNVWHSYMRDHVLIRLLHGGGGITHVHHMHAHQWLHSPNSDDSQYLDSQMINPGSTYTLDMVYNGSGNRNQTVGDSIFHCHFYPHFAGGMWGLWRIHDVFESGTVLDANDVPAAGWNRTLPDGEITAGTPIPALVPLPTIAMAPAPAPVRLIDNGRRVEVEPENGEYRNPGYPFFIPGVSGHRAPHPPLDFAWEEDKPGQPTPGPDGGKISLDGGLPRHLVLGGTTVNEFHTRWDFSKDFILYKNKIPVAGGLIAFQLPEDGTAVEKAAMAAHSQRTHPSFQPNGDAGNFTLNGLPPANGAPYANPSVDDYGNAQINTRRYQAAAIQIDAVFNKKGWHFPQQRMITLWEDVKPTVDGTRPLQPFFFRANTGETIEFWHTNLVPDYYQLDDFQVRTPTDIIGQHIHLVKFDVTASDGAANGFNYEDGTFSPDEVRKRIDAINLSGGLYCFDNVTQFALFPSTACRQTLKAKSALKVYGDPPPGQDWTGAQTTIQRWDTDPLLNNKGVDRTIRTVFTHDHFGPSTHQQVGLYGGLLVEPENSKWFDPTTGGLLYDTSKRSDGGPTDWQANIVTAREADSYREFALEFGDFQLAYTRQSPAPDERTGDPPSVPSAPVFNICPTSSGKNAPPCAVAGLIQQLNQGGKVSPGVGSAFSSLGVTLTGNATVSGSNGKWTIVNPLNTGANGQTACTDPKVVCDTYTVTGTATSALGLQVTAANTPAGWASPINAINPPIDASNQVNGPPYPTLISVVPAPGTFALNYRNEPVPSRLWDPAKQSIAAGPQGDLSFAYKSIPRADADLNVQPVPGSAIDPAQTNKYRFKFSADILPTISGPVPCNGTIPVVNVSKIQPCDPYTPILRAYANDNVQVRTLVGSQHDPHYFSIQGVKWLFEPSDPNSGYRSNQTMGISEHFEMLFQIPSATAASTSLFSDFFYEASAATPGVTNGLWGIMRAYNSRTADLLPLPNNPQPVAPAPAPIPTITRKFNVVATTAAQALPGQTLIYNSRGQLQPASPTAPPGQIADPFALIYFRAEDLDANGVLKPGVPIEPLVLRAQAGEWLEVNLKNAFDATKATFTQQSAALAPFTLNAPFSMVSSVGKDNFINDLNNCGTAGGVCTFTAAFAKIFTDNHWPLAAGSTVTTNSPTNWTIGNATQSFGVYQEGDRLFVYPDLMLRTSPQAGLRAQLVSSNTVQANGINVGFNPDATVGPGQSATFYWYAGEISTRDGKTVTTPIELGAVNLLPSDPLQQHVKGLVGALIVEPAGSTWKEDVNTRASATVTKADGSTFRDFVVISQDDLDLYLANNGSVTPYGGSTSSINYGTEPMTYRFPGGNTGGDISGGFADAQVQADPQTPVFVASAGSPVRFHMLHPAGGPTNPDGNVYTFDGHVWQEEPYVSGSREIGNNSLSQWFGTRGNHGPRDVFEVVLPSAGGAMKVPGDYVYRSLIVALGGGDTQQGVWGIFRVSETGKDAVVITSAATAGTQFNVVGVNTVNPSTGTFASSVQLFAGQACTGTPMGTAPVNQLKGNWSFTGAVPAPVPGSICALSADGGSYTYTVPQAPGAAPFVTTLARPPVAAAPRPPVPGIVRALEQRGTRAKAQK